MRVTEVIGLVANIQLNIDNLEAWMKPEEVPPHQEPRRQGDDRA